MIARRYSYAYGKVKTGHYVKPSENHKIFWAIETFMKRCVQTGIDVEALTKEENNRTLEFVCGGNLFK